MNSVPSSLLHRVGFILAQLPRSLGNQLPSEAQAPVKVPSVEGAAGGHGLVELKGLKVNGADFWADHSGGLLHNAGQQGLQPAMEALTWTEEGGGDQSKAQVSAQDDQQRQRSASFTWQQEHAEVFKGSL